MKLAACLLAPVLASGATLGGTVVFERVEPVEVRTGVIELRVVEAPLLEQPEFEDPGGVTWREARFTRLYGIDFALETRRRDGTQLEERGTLLLAVRTEADELLALDARIRAELSALGPDAFAAPLAGIKLGDPTDVELPRISVEPSWSCRIKGGQGTQGAATEHRQRIEESPGGRREVTSSGSSSFAAGEIPERVCAALRQGTQRAAPEVIRTLPSPRELHELRLELHEADTLPKELRREDLPSLPEGVQITRKRVPGVRSGRSWSPDGSLWSYTDQEIEWKAQAAPSPLSPDLLARGAHVSRWTLRERERHLGAAPRDETRTTAVRTAAFLPIAPPRLPEETLPPVLPVQLNAELLREDVGHEMDAASSVDGSVLEAALRGGALHAPQWLRSEGWLLVVCRDDGTAWFGLPPTGARNTVTNAALFCAALDRMLP